MFRTLALAALCASIWIPLALATGDLPQAQFVELVIRAQPNNPSSPAKSVIGLSLQAIDREGMAVGWRIQQIEFRRACSDGTIATWTHDLPQVPSPDGLWWVDHADPLAPLPGEFTVVPWLLGTARSWDARYSDLHFDFVGTTYQAQPNEPVYEATTSLSYTLLATSPVEPVDDSNDDEPVEIPDGTNDPLMQ
jgi:hypothetical protein